MSIPASLLASPPNICPKSVLKIARLDSFARYTFTFCVNLLTLIVMQVSLWLFLSCMRVFVASTMSVMEDYRIRVRVQDSKRLLFWRVSHRKTLISHLQRFGTLMGKKSRKLLPHIVHPNSLAPARNLQLNWACCLEGAVKMRWKPTRL